MGITPSAICRASTRKPHRSPLRSLTTTSSSGPNSMDSDTPTLRFRRTLHREAGNTLLLALVSSGVILLVGGNALRLAGNRLASVSQSTSWTRAYFLAESGV